MKNQEPPSKTMLVRTDLRVGDDPYFCYRAWLQCIERCKPLYFTDQVAYQACLDKCGDDMKECDRHH